MTNETAVTVETFYVHNDGSLSALVETTRADGTVSRGSIVNVGGAL